MIEQLIPLLVVAFIMGLYCLKKTYDYWRFLRELDAFEAHLRNITPTETPFMRSLKDTNV